MLYGTALFPFIGSLLGSSHQTTIISPLVHDPVQHCCIAYISRFSLEKLQGYVNADISLKYRAKLEKLNR